MGVTCAQSPSANTIAKRPFIVRCWRISTRPSGRGAGRDWLARKIYESQTSRDKKVKNPWPKQSVGVFTAPFSSLVPSAKAPAIQSAAREMAPRRRRHSARKPRLSQKCAPGAVAAQGCPLLTASGAASIPGAASEKVPFLRVPRSILVWHFAASMPNNQAVLLQSASHLPANSVTEMLLSHGTSWPNRVQLQYRNHAVSGRYRATSSPATLPNGMSVSTVSQSRSRLSCISPSQATQEPSGRRVPRVQRAPAQPQPGCPAPAGDRTFA